MVTKRDFLEMEASLWLNGTSQNVLKVDCLPNAVGKTAVRYPWFILEENGTLNWWMMMMRSSSISNSMEFDEKCTYCRYRFVRRIRSNNLCVHRRRTTRGCTFAPRRNSHDTRRKLLHLKNIKTIQRNNIKLKKSSCFVQTKSEVTFGLQLS